ncbi:MAG: Omp28-related outer membrane protein [Flavobacteriales bacterium]|nr:Omp28-related outer membrane protein [Flavobacteriales bacterium]
MTEDHITGWQTDYGSGGNQPNYDHRHVLRAYLTTLEGDEVTTTSQGDAITRTYSFTVPTDWDIAQCETVVFVSEAASGSNYGRYIRSLQRRRTMDLPTSVEPLDAGIGPAYPNPAATHVIVPWKRWELVDVSEFRDMSGRVLRDRIAGLLDRSQ